MSNTKRPEALAAHSGRIDFGLRNSANSTHTAAHDQAHRVAIIQKKKLEEIRVELSQFNGHNLVNVGVWAEPRDGGTERIPTKAGIACRVALIPKLIAALAQAELEARDRGLLS